MSNKMYMIIVNQGEYDDKRHNEYVVLSIESAQELLNEITSVAPRTLAAIGDVALYEAKINEKNVVVADYDSVICRKEYDPWKDKWV